MNLNTKTEEEIKKLIAGLEGKIVIVEGKKDMAALHMLGVNSVVSIEGRPLFEVVEAAAQKGGVIAVLTDLDLEGKKLYSKIAGPLSQRGVTIDNALRNFLFRKTKLRQIEGIYKLVRQDI